MTATVAPFGLSRIEQIAVNVHDVPRAVAFYRDVLGMRLLFEIPPKMAFFDCAGIRLMLSLPETKEFDHPGSIIYYAVADIEDAARELTARGVVFEQPPHMIGKMPQTNTEIWMGFFRDVDGNLLALTSQVRGAS